MNVIPSNAPIAVDDDAYTTYTTYMETNKQTNKQTATITIKCTYT